METGVQRHNQEKRDRKEWTQQKDQQMFHMFILARTGLPKQEFHFEAKGGLRDPAETWGTREGT